VLQRSGPTSTRIGFFPYGGYGYYGGGFGGGGLTMLLLFAAAAYFITQNAGSLPGGDDGMTGTGYGNDGRVTVAKLQVGLLADGRRLQKELQRIAGRADTSDSDGLFFVLQETVLALLRNPESCIYGHSEGRVLRGLSRGEEAYNQMSLEERGKMQTETFVNVDGRTRKGGEVQGVDPDAMDELIVVTLLVAYEGSVKLTSCGTREELKAGLQALGGLRAEQVLAVEVLWTPSDERDVFTRDDIMTDYPTLKTL
jgi:uncharacterized membrane protein